LKRISYYSCYFENYNFFLNDTVEVIIIRDLELLTEFPTFKEQNKNWLHFWEVSKNKKASVCRQCHTKNKNKNLVGVLVKIVSKSNDHNLYVVPICKTCNTENKNNALAMSISLEDLVFSGFEQ
jgi:hypothetical protein